MTHRRSLGFTLLLGAVIAASGFGLARQRQETVTLRREIEKARSEADELKRLQIENKKVREKQIPATELEALRADHAALPRLRSELETLKKGKPAGSSGVVPEKL